MYTRRGIAVSPGVVTGPAFVLGAEDFRIPQRLVHRDAVESELQRLHLALEAVWEDIAANEALASKKLGSQFGRIFAAHLEMARDPHLISEIEDLIRKDSHSPEFAVSTIFNKHAKILQNLDNEYLRERAADVIDLKKRTLGHLLGERRQSLAELTTPVVVLAYDLTPSETARLNKEFVLGFATEAGGHTSHTAILAGALEIPAVVGVGQFLSEVSGGETVILDGNHGEIIIAPDEASQETFRSSQERLQIVNLRQQSLRDIPAETKDGVRVELLGNIEFPEEVDHCTNRGADGIGLYRTEFLYVGNEHVPTEDDHYDAYCRVISAFQGKPVTIRTLDLGADKMPGRGDHVRPRDTNPAMGLRSIRLSLQDLELLKTQLRAILRAAVNGDVRIMFPLVSTLLELRHAKMIVSDVIEDLEHEGRDFSRDVPIGMMVEVPSAVIMADEFAREVDFFSVGTNDLIQYSLAADRSDPEVAYLYNSADPAILRMISSVIRVGRERDIPVSLCGQMCADPRFIPLLIGMGLRRISVTPASIPEIKEVLRQLTIPQAEEIAAKAASLELARDIENYLTNEVKNLYPDRVW